MTIRQSLQSLLGIARAASTNSNAQLKEELDPLPQYTTAEEAQRTAEAVVGDARDLVAFDTANGSGVVNGAVADSGHVWSVTGAGYLTTSFHPGGWIEGAQNTYCRLNTGQPVARYTQRYMGPMATLAIMKDETLGEMLHVNFTSSGGISASYWHAGLSGQWVKFFFQLNGNLPVLTDTAHDLTLDVVGDCFSCYVDGKLYGVGYDPLIPTFVGNWVFAQIHGAGERIYGVSTWKLRHGVALESNQPRHLRSSLLEVGQLSAASWRMGDSGSAGYQCGLSVNYWHGAGDHVFTSQTKPVVRAHSTVMGYGAEFQARSYVGVVTALISGNDGVGRITHQGGDRMTFAFNKPRVDFSARLSAAALPTSPDGLDAGELWCDVANGKVIKRV